MEVIFKLGVFIHDQKSEFRSHFYRHRALLNKNVWEVYGFEEFIKHEDLLELLAAHSPLEPEDLSDASQANILKEWNKKYPIDPKFYQMLQRQIHMWSQFKSHTLSEFLNSKEGIEWIQSRKNMNRKAYFELDTFYKRTKRTALENEVRVRELLRQNPLLRWEDLRELGVRNAQASLLNFPFLKKHRKEFLRSLKKNLPSEASHRAGSVESSRSSISL